MTWEDALTVFDSLLTSQEKIELESIDQVYYFRKKKFEKHEDGIDNFGYDNANGDYVCLNEKEHIMFWYEILGRMGSGSFG